MNDGSLLQKRRKIPEQWGLMDLLNYARGKGWTVDNEAYRRIFGNLLRQNDIYDLIVFLDTGSESDFRLILSGAKKIDSNVLNKYRYWSRIIPGVKQLLNKVDDLSASWVVPSILNTYLQQMDDLIGGY